jgi:hypothetical protein
LDIAFNLMILRTTFGDPSKANTLLLIEYFYSISGKRLKIACIRQYIFKTVIKCNLFNPVDRCHVQAAAAYLNYLINETDPNEHIEEIKTTIADILPFIKKLDPKEDCSFVLISPNTLPSVIHYKQAQSLFYKNCLQKEAEWRYHIDILVIYALRLSLEKRILGFLGIEYLLENGKLVGLSKIISLAANLKSVRFNPNIKWDEIKIVNDWLNYYMHRHQRPYPWAIHQAFEILNPLLLPGKVSNGKTQCGSIYASTFVENEAELQREIEYKIKKLKSDIEIKWLSERDILRAKK